MAKHSLKSDSHWVIAFGLSSAICGVFLSIYALYVSKTKSAFSNYEAYCDISETISCSKIFTSEYGYGFGFLHYIVGKDSPLLLSNSLFGILYYCLQILGLLWNHRILNSILLWLSVGSIAMSFYLAYILAYVLNDFCVVCVSTYVVNFILLAVNITIFRSGARKKRKAE